jgi:hypothetical protein
VALHYDGENPVEVVAALDDKTEGVIRARGDLYHGEAHLRIAAQPLELLYISTVTLAEIRFGIELLPDVARSVRAKRLACSQSETEV